MTALLIGANLAVAAPNDDANMAHVFLRGSIGTSDAGSRGEERRVLAIGYAAASVPLATPAFATTAVSKTTGRRKAGSTTTTTSPTTTTPITTTPTTPPPPAKAIIGIIDSGIDLDHPEYAGRVLAGKCFGYTSTICNVAGASVGGDPGVYPSQSTHGTHVAGIAAGSNYGVARDALILPVKTCDTYSLSCPGDIPAGIVWASQNGAKIISVSIAGSTLSTYALSSVQTAVANGAVVVVAAGNGGNAKVAGGFLAGAALKPGVRGGMIVVGAIDSYNKIASFSQTPGSTCETYSGATYCMRDYFVVAPGVNIKSSVGGGSYAGKSGTSMATPFVSGVAAKIVGSWSYLTPYQVADIIFTTAKDLGTPGTDNIYGRGAVDVVAAMAPVGGDSVIAATGGTSLASVTGVSGALNSRMAGALSHALRNSELLQNVTIIDNYGRNFAADLTGGLGGASALVSVDGALDSPQSSMTAFASTTNLGLLGTMSVAGFAEKVAIADSSGGHALYGDEVTLRNLALSFSPASGVGFDVGHNLNLGASFADFDTGAELSNGFLSNSTLASPYLGLADGGDYVGASIAPTASVKMRFGYQSLSKSDEAYRFAAGIPTTVADNSGREAQAMLVAATWNFAPWASAGLTVSHARERGSILGGFATGAFALDDLTTTSSAGFSTRMSMGEGWEANLSWSGGSTDLGLAPQGLIVGADRLWSQSYGMGITKRNVLGDDAVTFALSRPMHITGGSATLRAATGLDSDLNLIFDTERLSLASRHIQTDFEFGYVAQILGGAVALRTNAIYQTNVGGEAGRDGVAVLARAGLKL